MPAVQTVGTAVIRAADAGLLPFDFTRQASTIGKYLDELKKLAKDKRDEIIDRADETEFAGQLIHHRRFADHVRERADIGRVLEDRELLWRLRTAHIVG